MLHDLADNIILSPQRELALRPTVSLHGDLRLSFLYLVSVDGERRASSRLLASRRRRVNICESFSGCCLCRYSCGRCLASLGSREEDLHRFSGSIRIKWVLLASEPSGEAITLVDPELFPTNLVGWSIRHCSLQSSSSSSPLRFYILWARPRWTVLWPVASKFGVSRLLPRCYFAKWLGCMITAKFNVWHHFHVWSPMSKFKLGRTLSLWEGSCRCSLVRRPCFKSLSVFGCYSVYIAGLVSICSFFRPK